MEKIIAQFRSRHEMVKPFLPAAGFIGGWTWDSLTLKRIDNPLDLAIIGFYLIITSVLLVLINRGVKFKYEHLMPAGIQFLFGGILSPFTVYYFKSAASINALLFTGVIVGLLVANEFFEARFKRGRLVFIMLSICYFLYFTFLVPVVLKHMNGWVFVVTIILSLAVSYGLVKLLGHQIQRMIPIAGMYLLFFILYAANIIPPVPLSTKQISIYRSVVKKDDTYRCQIRKPAWYKLNKSSERNFEFSAGDSVFCFTSIFAPTRLTKQVAHHWYRKIGNDWVRTDIIPYPILGGREGGYRGYTFKTKLNLGKWKVDLKTDDGKTLGSVSFRIIPAGSTEMDYKTIIN